jgi:protein-tyrosine phosphatase
MPSVLVVCVGNICRSPIAEGLLRRDVAALTVSSAGLHAVVGHGVQSEMATLGESAGLTLSTHRARQFTPVMGAENDLILVMERAHRDEISHIAPHLLGRTMLFDHWLGAKGIADPYRMGQAAYERSFAEILNASKSWVTRLAKWSK